MEELNKETGNVQQNAGQVNNQAENVGEIVNKNGETAIANLEQELTQKASDLEAQRSSREQQLVTLTLNRIAGGVVPKEAEINTLIEATKGKCQNPLKEIVMREIIRSADDHLWCPEYVQRSGSDQRVVVFTGSYWEPVEPQQWTDFVRLCAEKCGMPESMLMNHNFMNLLSEATAFQLAKYRRQVIPNGEVWLNLRNATLVIKSDGTVALHEHNKNDLFFYCLPYSYDPQAECPQWHAFLDRVLPEQDAQRLLAEYIGYCLMKDHSMEKMLLLYGEGLNGKSVTLEIIEALLGQMNVSYMSLADLTNDDVKRAAIVGKMLNISHESGKDVNPNVLKQLTSGERVTVRRLYHNPVETNDYGKLVAAFNVLPRAENTFGFFRRLIFLPYLVTIPKEEIDRLLAVKLKTELPGILGWVLEMLPGLMARREFSPCESSDKALEQYRLQSDNVRLFLNEACEVSEYTTQASEIFTAYRTFCINSSLKPVSRNKFYDRLEKLGHERVTYSGTLYFKLKLTEQ